MPAMTQPHPSDPFAEGAVPFDEAIHRLASDGERFHRSRGVPSERVALEHAIGRTLAADVASLCDHPNVDDASLDGIACRAADTTGASDEAPVRLALIGESAAGRPFDGVVGSGQAVRIQTGAALPEGADAIVPVERLEDDGDGVRVHEPGRTSAVRPKGQDVQVGDIGLEAGRRVDAAAVALAAAMGHERLEVRRPLRVAIVTGGDEVVPPGRPLAPGQVYDANGPLLAALVRAAGAEPTVVQRVGDAEGALDAVLEQVRDADLLLTCGGISMGRYDRARDLIRERGRVIFRKVLLKPGGPATFAYLDDLPWLALPGNPVSAAVTFLALGRAWLDRAGGRTGPLPVQQRLAARAGAPLRAAGPKTTLLRVTGRWEEGRYVVRPAGDQTSSVVRTLALADALAVVPGGARLEPGDRLEAIPLAPHLG
jgi:molybdopterin molybdotransferase